MPGNQTIRSERGVALVTVLLVSLVAAVLTTAAVMLSQTNALINRYAERTQSLDAVADGGLEQARSRVNRNAALYPATGYATLENDATVRDADGNVIPNVTRSVYVGPTGITSGQYGVFGSIVSVAQDAYGNRVVRRQEIVQSSFARFAYFTNDEGPIVFGGGDQIFGPAHSNDDMTIHSTGATFFGAVTTARRIISPGNGTFVQGFTEGVPVIPMPQLAQLAALLAQAVPGRTNFTSSTVGSDGQATTRIEFVAIDLDGDGQVNGDNEGFIRVYDAITANQAGADWVTADIPATSNFRSSPNCGDFHAGVFRALGVHPPTPLPITPGPSPALTHNWNVAATTAGTQCFLGGDPRLFGGFTPTDSRGRWRAWPGTVSGLLAGRPDAAYLFPITRALNPDFKGVIHVTGDVVLSGVLRGRVTVAATGNIVIGDDLTYATNPGAGTCVDILGMFAGGSIVVAENTLNAPLQPGVTPSSANGYRTYDDTRDEFIDGFVLSLNSFTVENYNSGSTNAEPCGGNPWGRGCLFVAGGIIQGTRGAVGTAAGYGYVKRYSYDQCGLSDPPPYFPTTGVFSRGRYYEIDPVGFNVAALFASLTPS